MPSVTTSVVIGAGAIGLAVALELTKRGHRVIVADSGAPGSGTTGTTFAWVNANDKPPRHYHELNRAGIEAHRAFADAEGGDWLRLTGHLEWTTGGNAAALAPRAARMREWGYPVEALTAAEARRLDPDVRIPPDAEIRFFAAEGYLLPAPFVAHLIGRLTELGATVVRGRVVAFERAGDRLRAAVLADGRRVAGDRFVACAGRWSAEVARLAGSSVPMTDPAIPSRVAGFLGYSPPVRTRLTRVVSSPGLNVRPDGGGRLVLQAIDLDQLATPGVEPTIDNDVAREIVRRGRDLLDGFDVDELESIRVGLRSIPADGFPVTGWAPGADGLYVLTTHSGITLSIILGRLAAEEISTGREAAALAPFRPARFTGAAAPAAP